MSAARDSRALTSGCAHEPQHLAGSIERVAYHNSETGFCVLHVRAQGRRGLVPVVGRAPAVAPGEFLDAQGAWVNDRVHGMQFQAELIATAAPTTADGLELFFGSGFIPGIGSINARQLVEAFGSRLVSVIERSPHRLRDVPGIGTWRANQIVQGWAAQQAVREIVVFLASHGIGQSRAMRIYKAFGREAVRMIEADPYCLARDIRGIGFATADRIAGRLGMDRRAIERLRAGVVHVLGEAAEEGHCGLPVEEVIRRAAGLLGVPQALVSRAIDQEVIADGIVADWLGARPAVFLAGLYGLERSLGQALASILAGTPARSVADPETALVSVEGSSGLTLGEEQKAAMRLALASKAMVITGGPGTGKTTLLGAILQVADAAGARIALCAPTGRAAKRLSESTGREAKTIHRLLEVDALDGSFQRGPMNRLDCDLLVVDEMSMVDVRLMHALVRALPERAALLMVGDVDQLPSIGPGRVLADVIESRVVPVARLTQVFRQAEVSRIVTAAHRINRGELPEDEAQPESDFYVIPADEPEDALRKIVTLVRERIPRRFGLDPLRDIQVLCPMLRGGLGVRALNFELQQVLNPPGERRIERYGSVFAPGDKVMQIQNDYERDVFNGDIGIVREVEPSANALLVDFDGREVIYGSGELDELVLAYATTIHKAQGSEYPAVVVPLTLQHAPMLRRDLLYTAVTRGRQLVVLVGSRDALAVAVGGSPVAPRWSKLREWVAAP